MIASMVRATGVLLILAGGGLYGAPPANEALLCVQEPSHLTPEETIRHCTAAIQSGELPSADLVAALVSRCHANEKKGEYARALPDCERAVQLAPQSATAVHRRGWVRYHSGDLDGAMLDFEQAILLDPNLAPAYRGRAAVYIRRAAASNSAVSAEQYDQAIRNLEEALRLKPDGDTYCERGWCYFQKQSYDSAKEDLDEAIRRGSGAQAYYYRGWYYIYKENYSEAIADFDQAINLEPKVAEAYSSRGWVHNRQREYNRAIRDYTDALRLKPDAESYRGRAWAYYYSGSYALAFQDSARASWRVWVPLVLVAGLLYIFGRLRKAKQTESPAEVSGESPADDELVEFIELPDAPSEELPPPPEPSRDSSSDTDLDVLIRTGLRDRIAIGLAEGTLQGAGIPFFVTDQNPTARQEGGNAMDWWNIRVPHEREAEAREIIRAVEEMK